MCVWLKLQRCLVVCVCVCVPPPPSPKTRYPFFLFIYLLSLLKNTSSFVPTSASLGNFSLGKYYNQVGSVCVVEIVVVECRYWGLNKKRLKFRSTNNRLSPPSSCVYSPVRRNAG